MARHRHDLGYGIALDALSITKIQPSDFAEVTTLLSVEPRIISDELCLRVQQWVMFDQDEVPTVAQLLRRLTLFGANCNISIEKEVVRHATLSSDAANALLSSKWTQSDLEIAGAQ